jgi:hypothetical protein
MVEIPRQYVEKISLIFIKVPHCSWFIKPVNFFWIDLSDYSRLPNGLVFVLGIYSHFVHRTVKNIRLWLS